MNYIQLEIFCSSAEKSEILIALLSDWGFEGFEEDEDILKAFIPEKLFDEIRTKSLLLELALKYTTQQVAERNWNLEWERDFEPVVVGNFCAIRASFHPPVSGVLHDILITPKMSFGTGHHATTYLMVEAMSTLPFPGKKVFDFGTGTGVLAILSEKLGATEIEAIDIDDWSIENAHENIIENGCSHILVEKRAVLPENQNFDIILANINRNVILANLKDLEQQLNPAGVLLVSGLLASDLDLFKKEAEIQHFNIKRVWQRENWVCIELSK